MSIARRESKELYLCRDVNSVSSPFCILALFLSAAQHACFLIRLSFLFVLPRRPLLPPKRMEKHEGPNHHHHDGCCMSNTTGRYLVPAKLASCKVNSQIIFSQLFKVWMSLTLRGDYGLRPSTETWKRRSTFLREVCDPFAIHFNNFPQESALIYAITMDTHHSTTPHMQARWKCVSSSSLTTRT